MDVRHKRTKKFNLLLKTSRKTPLDFPAIVLNCQIFNLSERDDSNVRPLAPHASALANCATPRF